jgi:hypothetical protein
MAHPRMIAKFGSDIFTRSSFAASSDVKEPIHFVHRMGEATPDTFGIAVAVTISFRQVLPSNRPCPSAEWFRRGQSNEMNQGPRLESSHEGLADQFPRQDDQFSHFSIPTRDLE